MAKVQANGITIEVQEMGSPADPPILLIMGLNAQLTVWPEGFCRGLADRGHRVIRFDNRDVGLSTWLDEHPPDDPIEALFTVLGGGTIEAPYSLADMADDAVGVLDALDLGSAHIVGASLGGMIGQHVVTRHPDRVRTFTSIMSMPRFIPMGIEVALSLQPPEVDPSDREAIVLAGIEAARLFTGTGYPFDEAYVRREALANLDRAWHPDGGVRQVLAALADGDRRPALSAVDVPTLVVHGTDDPLILPQGGQETADAIPGAELVWIEGMGHELPEGAWPQILNPISELAARFEAAGTTG
jgi:pimeloyl-ACP methyl ester carboxylesterase